jgi:protein dithiol oxidoreductase (disulfide-forming)
MLKRALLLIALLAALVAPHAAMAQLRWVEGRHYITLPPSPTYAPPAGKIEVTEVFSYGCIACNQSYKPINKIKAALPSDTVLSYVPASFIPTEAWPMFQQAYLTAKALGIADATHEMMFVAVWDTDEIPLVNKQTRTIRQPLPTIEDAARFYSRHTAVKEPQFLEKARSFEIAQQMKRSDELVKIWKIPSTPSLVVNGRYLINNQEAGSWDAVQQIVLFLVAQERVRLKMPAPKP